MLLSFLVAINCAFDVTKSRKIGHFTSVLFTRPHYQNKKLCYRTENSASVMLSWFIHWLKALSDERDKMLSNKASLYETSQSLNSSALQLFPIIVTTSIDS